MKLHNFVRDIAPLMNEEKNRCDGNAGHSEKMRFLQHEESSLGHIGIFGSPVRTPNKYSRLL